MRGYTVPREYVVVGVCKQSVGLTQPTLHRPLIVEQRPPLLEARLLDYCPPSLANLY